VKLTLGNDLIDFRARHNRGRAEQPRLLARVLTARERTQLADEAADDVGFALLWSAKEAAYKAAKKADPALVFAPGRWQLECADMQLRDDHKHGQVVIAEHPPITVSWQWHAHWLHCIAVQGQSTAAITRAVVALADCPANATFSERERDSFSREPSAMVRTLAKRLLAQQGINDTEIVRERVAGGLLPPRVFSDGVARDDIQLSLSHDGDYVAAVIAFAA